ncbi:MAG: hypothetical protein WAM14_06190 [Candidatus Nitrosopolaris sp.]
MYFLANSVRFQKNDLNEVSTEGKQILPEEQDKGINRPTKRQPSNRIEYVDKLKLQQAGELEALVEENDELKEVVRRQTSIQSADQVSQSELEFIVPTTRYEDLRHAMKESENLIHLIFDKSGTFMHAKT